MFQPASANPGPLIRAIVGTGGILKGQLGMVSSDTIIDATEGQTTAILFGVAAENGDAGDVISFYPLVGKQFKVPIYQGGATDTALDAHVGADFDLEVSSNIHYVDLNDTTNPMMHLLSYDNDEHTAIVQFKTALCII